MNIKAGWLLLIAISLQTSLYGKELPKDYFRSPVDFTITLSGNFGELRNNHFHSGIDIRTFTTGKKVYAAAQGSVSRIKISAGGYGKALYIDHPNGYTTVYGHLKSFNPELEAYVKSVQYRKKSFQFDIEIPKGKFPLKKGSIVAYSGNTGSSAGPHLHFEIRDTKSEHPLNPLLFNFRIKDTKAPKIFNLFIYPLDHKSSVNGKTQRQKFAVTYYNNRYHLKGAPSIQLHGKIGFALETNDYMDNTWSKCGIYSLNMHVDGMQTGGFEIPEFSFNESRYINSHMDYQLNKKNRKRIHKCFIAPNNKLSIYNKMANNGMVSFKDDQTHSITFTIKDANNNKALLGFKIKSTSATVTAEPQNCTQAMPYDQINEFKRDSLEVIIPLDGLYDTLYFDYKKHKNTKGYYSDIYEIHNELTPVHKHFTLGIRPNQIPTKYQEKVLIAKINGNGKLQSAGGLYFDSWVKTKVRDFGKYVVTVDTIAPTIKALKNYKGLNLRALKKLEFLIKDELSGIQSYEGTIDDKWVLFEYDAKKDKIFYIFDKKRLRANQKHHLTLIITDKKGNSTNYSTSFTW